MGRVLAAIEVADRRLRARPAHPLLGCGSLQPITIGGGTELFVTPDACRLSVERRTLPGEGRGQLEAELEAVLAEAGAGVPGFDAAITLQLHREPFETPSDAPIVRLAVERASEARGAPAPLTGAPYWTDAALVAAAGIPTVLLGPAGEGLHAAEEWVDLGSVARLERALAGIARDFCG
jgi:acetylornithine deacetylase